MRRAALPALAVLVGSLAFEIGYRAPLGDSLLYVAYELCFVVVPGWLVYRALSHRPGGALRQLAIGWALGYVLEILAFMLTAEIGLRGLFTAYPLVVAAVVAAALVLARRRPGALGRGQSAEGTDAEPSLPPYFEWVLVAVCLGAITYIGLSYFPATPLPGAKPVGYFIDYPRWIALAADAKHHWPITDPSVAGEPLPYHYFVNVHLAAASQVTGLGLPLVYFRFFIFPLVALSVLLLVVAGRSLTRNAWVGLLAACIAVFIGELRLDPSNTFLAHTPFFGLFFTLLFRSPSFLLGLVLFIPLMTLVGERITVSLRESRPGDWLLLALFVIGASDAKISILPLLLAALFIFAGWRWLLTRRIPVSVWVAGAMVILVMGSVYALQYTGHSSGLRLDPLSVFDEMPAVQLIKGDLAGHLPAFPAKGTLLSVGGTLLGIFGLLAAPLVGILWLIRRGHRPPPIQTWLFSLLAAGVVMGFAFKEPGTQSALYFLFYGLVAGYVLSAEGLRVAWERRPPLADRELKRLALLGLAFAVVACILIAAARLELFSGSRGAALTYMFRYGGLILALIVLYVAGRRWIGPTRWPARALLTVAVLAVGALATPFDNLKPVFTGPAGASESLGKEMSPGLYRALTWIRESTPESSVIAVNNHWIDSTNLVPLEFNYSAFSERRVFLEGWAYSQRSRDLGYPKINRGVNPFESRLRLNQAALTKADRGALRAMTRRYGVHYLVIDKPNGFPADLAGLLRFSRVAYRAPGVVVLELDAS